MNEDEKIEETEIEEELTEVEQATLDEANAREAVEGANPLVEVKRPVLYYPDPRLDKVSDPVDFQTENPQIVTELVEDLIETLKASMGLGLSAPQVGVSKRVFVMKVPTEENKDPEIQVFINPEIITMSGSRGTRVASSGNRKGAAKRQGRRRPALTTEGCTSFPGILVKTARFENVSIAYYDLDGYRHQAELTGLSAHVIQHEVNHLDGITLFTRMDDIQKIKNKRGLYALRRLADLQAKRKAAEEAEAAKATEPVSVPQVETVEQADLY